MLRLHAGHTRALKAEALNLLVCPAPGRAQGHVERKELFCCPGVKVLAESSGNSSSSVVEASSLNSNGKDRALSRAVEVLDHSLITIALNDILALLVHVNVLVQINTGYELFGGLTSTQNLIVVSVVNIVSYVTNGGLEVVPRVKIPSS